MPLVFAGILPHSPVLVPTIGRAHRNRAKKTLAAIERLEGDLYAAFPDTLLVISPQGPVEEGHFTIDVKESYRCDLREFGDMETSLECAPDRGLVQAVRERLEDDGLPIMLRSEETMDHGIVVPLTHLTRHMKRAVIVPVYPSLLDLKTHFAFGRSIREALLASDRRVAVIASVGLSHRLSEDAPGGFSPRARDFDDRVLQLLSTGNAAGLLNFDEGLAEESGETCLTSLAILMGILDKTGAEAEVLSYEAPFGIGWLVAEYHHLR